jgi:tetratricopeptide (TPR) repeat protein
LSPLPPYARLRAMQRLGAVTAAVTTVFVCAASAARASGAQPDFEAARTLYHAGQEAAAEGRYDEAARAYEQAYEVTGDPVLHFRIADAYQRAGACERALGHYQRYLDEAHPPEVYAEIALRRVNACQDEILTAREAGSPPAARPTAGSRPAKRPPHGPPNAIPTEDQPADALPLDAIMAEVVERQTWHRGAAWTSTGLAVVIAATSGILAASASARERDLERLLAVRDPETGSPLPFEGHVAERYESLRREGDRYARASQVAIGAAGAAAVTAALLFLVDPTRGGPASARRDAGALVPSLAPAGPHGGVGVAATWEF